MQRVTLAGGIPEALRGSIVALGNFDGFHLGHQAVVRRAIDRAFHERRPAVVATFDPHPVIFFKPDVPPFRLTTLDQRQALFDHAGADAMLVFEFGAALASMDAEAFVAEVLVDQIGAAGVITGDDFSFGKGRTGDPALLRALGERHGLAAEAVPQVLLEGQRISSGRIREALVGGDTGTATHMLSRDFAIEGVAQRGDARGRQLGFPTANVTLDDGTEHPGVANLGVRPTFQPPQELLEAYLFGFEGDLYGRRIEAALHAYIREERKFGDLDGLVAQMREDEAAARRLLLISD